MHFQHEAAIIFANVRKIISASCDMFSMSISNAMNIQIRFLSNFIRQRRFSSINSSLKKHKISIRTCGKLYRKWREEEKFRILPDGDLNFNITYIDNIENPALKARKSVPVIVAIHGAPGSYKDFVGLSYFEQKARIIVPNFPDFSVYKPGIFRFSDEEKAQLLKDFLSAISVKKIDALIVHSSGIYPGLNLCLDNNLPIKALIMLNSGTHTNDMKFVKHFKLMSKLVAMSEIPTFLTILNYLGPTLLKMAKIPVRTDNFLNPLLSATTMTYANIPEAKAKFLQLSQKKFPMLYIFAKDDKLVGEKASHELADLLGVSNSEIFTFDKDGTMINEGKDSAELKVMSFEKGSHYVFWKHPDLVFKAIQDFLRRNMINV